MSMWSAPSDLDYYDQFGHEERSEEETEDESDE
jgi:hypothetical protein